MHGPLIQERGLEEYPKSLSNMPAKHSPKVVHEVILSRTLRILNEAQQAEQARFRLEVHRKDHIQTVLRVMKVYRVCSTPLVLNSINYEKAFDSVEPSAVLSTVVDQDVNPSSTRSELWSTAIVTAVLRYSFTAVY